MKDIPLSNCEKSFVISAIKENLRLDGRKNDEFRAIKINFGADYGGVFVSLGETKVLAQVSCELGQPKATRPSEGMMFINVELGPMAAIHFEAGRNSDLNVQINRTLERTLKDSRCVDMESLCVKAEERVWVLRLDLNVLNHEGNLIDCCSIAALSALAHFKHPDVSVLEDEIKIHTEAEKELIPIVLHHYPVCVSYCTFDNGQIAAADPTAIEERVAESNMVFGINSYRELCCLNLSGSTLTSVALLMQCSSRAANRAKCVVELIKSALEEDSAVRSREEPFGFTECLRMQKITSLEEDKLMLKLRHFTFNNEQNSKAQQISMETETAPYSNAELIGENTLILHSNQSTIKWVPDDDDDDDLVEAIGCNNISDGDDSDNIDNLVNKTLQHSHTRSNQPLSKIKNMPPLSRNNLQTQFIESSDSEEDKKEVLE